MFLRFQISFFIIVFYLISLLNNLQLSAEDFNILNDNFIVAKVDDEIITKFDFISRQKIINTMMQHSSNTPLNILDALIDEKIAEIESKKFGLTVSNSMIDNAIMQISSNINNGSEINNVLQNNHLLNELRKVIKGQLMIRNLIDFYIDNQVFITDTEKKDKDIFVEHMLNLSLEKNNTINNSGSLKIYAIESNPQNINYISDIYIKSLEFNKDFDFILSEIKKNNIKIENYYNIGWVNVSDININQKDVIEKAIINNRTICDPIKIKEDLFLIIFIIDSKDISMKKITISDKEKNTLKNNILFEEISKKEIEKWIDIIRNNHYVELYNDSLNS
ncbi:hypothetical protein [Lyticum sinuosum]|uniref:PrsA/SurA chaperone n=1 Tax=Lyticum sinuosum TaxID=1332059 RepID=A0AAE5AI00_9RICK|nr:hypothetical protein [Lyticum sinuosum]MDZ5761404.1 PrsA/SurA chaperone [Lyticum sinuosum]